MNINCAFIFAFSPCQCTRDSCVFNKYRYMRIIHYHMRTNLNAKRLIILSSQLANMPVSNRPVTSIEQKHFNEANSICKPLASTSRKSHFHFTPVNITSSCLIQHKRKTKSTQKIFSKLFKLQKNKCIAFQIHSSLVLRSRESEYVLQNCTISRVQYFTRMLSIESIANGICFSYPHPDLI